MSNKLMRRVMSKIDVEMWKKGWWMLLLIFGTIAILFTTCCILVFRHKG